MKNTPQLIVMLTHNDRTVMNAPQIFDACKNSKATIWGFKEEPLPLCEMKSLFDKMRGCGKTTALEVVAYCEEECLNGAKLAVECGCDLLLGTVFSASKYLTTNMNPLSLTGKGFELLGALSYERKEHRIPSNDNYYNDYYDYCGQVLVISDIDLEKERLYSYISEKQ